MCSHCVQVRKEIEDLLEANPGEGQLVAPGSPQIAAARLAPRLLPGICSTSTCLSIRSR